MIYSVSYTPGRRRCHCWAPAPALGPRPTARDPEPQLDATLKHGLLAQRREDHGGPAKAGPHRCATQAGAGAQHRRIGTVEGQYFAPLAPGTEAPSRWWRRRNGPPAPPGTMLRPKGGPSKWTVFRTTADATFHLQHWTLGGRGAGP